MTNPPGLSAWRQLAPVPTHLAAAGFGIAGVILVALDLQRPQWAVTNTISSYATGPAGLLYVVALLAAAAGVAAAVLAAGRAVTRIGPGGLLLMTLWPIGIALGTMFDQAEHTVTGMVHNVSVGTAIVGVHLAAVRMGSRALRWIAGHGAGGMAAMIVLLVLHSFTGLDMPVGLAERVLIGLSVVLVIGTFRVHVHRSRVPAEWFVPTVPDMRFSSRPSLPAEG